MLTEDPIRDGLNYYTYCSNNPLFFIDPLGLYEVVASDHLKAAGFTTSWINNTYKNGVLYANSNVYWSKTGELVATISGRLDTKTNRMMVDNTLSTELHKIYNPPAEYHPVRDTLVIAGTIVTFAKGPAVVNAVKKAAPVVGPVAVSAANKVKDVGQQIVDKAGSIINSVGNGACFIAGTKIATEDGFKLIEDVCAGDLVYSQDVETGEKGLKQVTQTFINQTNELVYIQINGEEIATTPDHPFYVPEKGWVGADQLYAGEKLLLLSDKVVIIDNVRIDTNHEPIVVYNFEVENWHTYYVSESCFLVHNTCSKPIQVHHLLSDKSSKYTPIYQQIVSKYGLKLNAAWNKVSVPHQGPHSAAYHNFMIDQLTQIDKVANGNQQTFLDLFNVLKQHIINNPGILYNK